MPNLTDLTRSPQEIKKKESENKKQMEVGWDSDKYPDGLRIRFDEETIGKVPAVSGAKKDQRFKIIGELIVKSSEEGTRDNGKSYENISLQLIKADIVPVPEKEDFDAVFEEKSKK